MIFQPSGGAGSGEGLTFYDGYLASTKPNETLETPVKLVFVSHDSDIPLWFIILPGEGQYIYSTDNGGTWPPERLGRVTLSADGKTLSSNDKNSYLYYAIG